MIEIEEFPLVMWHDIEKHFVEIMCMKCDYDAEFEKTYSDNHITMIVSIAGKTPNDLTSDKNDPDWGIIPIRITIKNWRSQKSFSRTDLFDSTSENIVDHIYNMVYYKGDNNRDILNEWREIKKPEIRDIKLGKLGI